MDRVRFEDDERLDLPDTKALQSLVYEYIGRMLGAFMGRPLYEPNSPIGGWLTCVNLPLLNNKSFAQPFKYYYTYPPKEVVIFFLHINPKPD